MTNAFQPFKQSGFEFVQHGHFEAVFLTIGKAGGVSGLPEEYRKRMNHKSSNSRIPRTPAGPARGQQCWLPVYITTQTEEWAIAPTLTGASDSIAGSPILH